jgi:hypothetical protein
MRFRVTVAALLAVAAAIAIWLNARRDGGEPRYQGQPLSFWVQQCVPSTSNLPYSVTLSDEGATAVRQMDTHALPVLLRWMRYPEHDLRLKLLESLQRKQGQRGRIFFATARLLTPRSYQPGSAVLAFQALGPSMRCAVPALTRMLHEPRNARTAASALCALGPDGIGALGETLPTVGDGSLRANILLEFYPVTSPELQHALSPLLVRRLKEDTSGGTRMAAAQVLARFSHAAGAAVPALAAALRDRDGGVRLVAADGLGRFGPEAASAVAALEAALSDPNPAMRSNATNALLLIQGTAAPSDGGRR